MLSLVLLLAFCGSTTPQSTLRLGLIHSGDPILPLVARLAIDEVNNLDVSGGVTLALAWTTSETCSKEVGIAAGEEASDHTLDVLVDGVCSQVSLALQVTLASNIVHVAYNSRALELADEDQFPLFTRTCGSSAVEAMAIETFLQAKEWQRVAVLAGNDAYSNSTASALEDILRLRGTAPIVSVRWSVDGANDTATVFQAFQDMKVRNVLIVVVVCLAQDVYDFLQTAASFVSDPSVFIFSEGAMQGIRDLTNSLFPGTPGYEVVRSVLRWAIGLEETESKRKPAIDFLARFQQLSQPLAGYPRVSHRYAYDAIWAVARAVRLCKTSGVPFKGPSLAAALRSLKFQGAGGEINLSGNSTHGTLLFQTLFWPFVRPFGTYSNGNLAIEDHLLTHTWFENGALTSFEAQAHKVAVVCEEAAVGSICASVIAALDYANTQRLVGRGNSISYQVFDSITCSALKMRELAEGQLLRSGFVAIVGQLCSAAASALVEVVKQIPVVLASTTAPHLSDSELYPNLLRTTTGLDGGSSSMLPSMRFVLGLGWRRIGVICVRNDPWASASCADARKQAASLGIWADVHVVNPQIEAELLVAAQSLMKVRVRVVIIFENGLSPVIAQFLRRQEFFTGNQVCIEGNNQRLQFPELAGFPEVVWHPFLEFPPGAPAAVEAFNEAVKGKVTASARETTGFDAGAVLVHGLAAARSTRDFVELMNILRSLQFEGASGFVSFPTSGSARNDRIIRAAQVAVMRKSPHTQFIPVGWMTDEGPNFTTPLSLWEPSQTAPIACPRGTRGVQKMGQSWYNCEPCAAGSGSFELDSSTCTPCTECPFASPSSQFTSQPRLETVPVPRESLGSASQRTQLLIWIFVPVALVVLVVVYAWTASWTLHFDLFSKWHHTCDSQFLLNSKTPHGGAVSLLVALLAAGASLYLLLSMLVIDNLSVKHYEDRGLMLFRPETLFDVTVYVLGSETATGAACQQFCNATGDSDFVVASSANVPWNWTCHSAEDRGGCRVNAWPIMDSSFVLPSEFWLRLELAQTRVHGFQWIVSTKLQGETEYFTSGNVTAPHGTVFVGGQASSVHLDLKPTAYKPSGRKQQQGYVPYTLFTRPGAVSNRSTYFNFGEQFHSALVVRFSVETKVLSTFEEVSTIAITETFSEMVSASKLLFLLGIALVTAIEAVLVRFGRYASPPLNDVFLRVRDKSLARGQVRAVGLVASTLCCVVFSTCWPQVDDPRVTLSNRHRPLSLRVDADSPSTFRALATDLEQASATNFHDDLSHVGKLPSILSCQEPTYRSLHTPSSPPGVQERSRPVNRTVTVGLLDLGYKEVPLALDMAIAEVNAGLLFGDDAPTLRVVLHQSRDCSVPSGSQAGAKFVEEQVDVFMSGSCSVATNALYEHAHGASIPLLGFWAASPAFDDKTAFPYFTRVNPSGRGDAEAFLRFIEHFNWQRLAIIRSSELYSETMASELQASLAQRLPFVNVSYTAALSAQSSANELTELLKEINDMDVRVLVGFLTPEDTERLAFGATTAGFGGNGTVSIFNFEAFDTLALLMQNNLDSSLQWFIDGALGWNPVASESASSAFSSNWVARGHSIPPGLIGTLAYDAVWALTRAVILSQQSGFDLRVALDATVFQGAFGEVHLMSPGSPPSLSLKNIAWPFVRTVGSFQLGMLSVNEELIRWPGGAASPPSAQIYRVALLCKSACPRGTLLSLERLGNLGFLGGGDVLESLEYSSVDPDSDALIQQLLQANVTAFLSSLDSIPTMTLLGQVPGVPHISCSTWATPLGNSTRYPWFLRTTFPTHVQFGGLVPLLTQMGWQHVGFLLTEAAHGVEVPIFHALAEAGVQVEAAHLPAKPTAKEVAVVAADLARRHSVLVGNSNLGKDESVYEDALDSIGFNAPGRAYISMDLAWRDFEHSLPMVGTRLQISVQNSSVMVAAGLDSTELEGEAPCWNSVELLADSIRALKNEFPSMVRDPATLMQALRRTKTGDLAYPQSGEWANDPLPHKNLEFMVLNNVDGLPLEPVGRIRNGNLTLFRPPRWPGNETLAPISCTRGTRALLRPSHTQSNCVMCAEGTFASSTDSLDCQVCPADAFCPVAAPGGFYGDWQVLSQTRYPEPTLSLASEKDREAATRVVSFSIGLTVTFMCLGTLVLQTRVIQENAGQLRKQINACIRKCDVVFPKQHIVPTYSPLIKRRTVFGGLMTLVCLFTALNLAAYILYTGFLDRVGLSAYQAPGLRRFQPQEGFHVVLYTVGMDTSTTACQQFCSATADSHFVVASSANVPWNWTCHSAEDRGGCRVNAWPIMDSSFVLPSEFWLRLELAQTRVHGFQWIVSTKFQGETEYFTSDNITLSQVDARRLRCRAQIDLQPTLYRDLLQDGTLDAASGYVPFTLETVCEKESPVFRPSVLEILFHSRLDSTAEFTEYLAVSGFRITNDLVGVSIGLVAMCGTIMRLAETAHAYFALKRGVSQKSLLFGVPATAAHGRREQAAALVLTSVVLVMLWTHHVSSQAQSVPEDDSSSPMHLPSPQSSPVLFQSLPHLPDSRLRRTSTWLNNTAASAVRRSSEPISRGESREYVVGVISSVHFAGPEPFLVARDELHQQDILLGDSMKLLILADNCSRDFGLDAGRFFESANVVAVVGGGCSESSLGSYSVTSSLQIPQIAFSATALLFDDTTSFPVFSRTCPSGSLESRAIAALLHRFAWQHIAILHSNSSLAFDLVAHLEQLLQEAGVRPVLSGAWSSNGQLEEWLRVAHGLGVRLLVLVGTAADSAQSLALSLSRERTHGLGTATIASAGLSEAVSLLLDQVAVPEHVKMVTDGWIGLEYMTTPSTHSERFEFAYKALRTGEFPQPWAAFAYDAVVSLGRAIQQCKSQGVAASGVELQKRIREVAFGGASGEVNLRHADSGELRFVNFVSPYTRSIGRYTNGEIELYDGHVRWPGGATRPVSAMSIRVLVLCRDETCAVLRAALDETVVVIQSLQQGDSVDYSGELWVDWSTDVCNADFGQRVGRIAIERKAHAIVGDMCSEAALSLTKVVQNIPIIVNSEATVLANSTAYPNMILIFPRGSNTISLVVSCTITLGWRRVVLACDDSVWAQESCNVVVPQLARFGIKVVRWDMPSTDGPSSLVPLFPQHVLEASVVILFEVKARLMQALGQTPFFDQGRWLIEPDTYNVPFYTANQVQGQILATAQKPVSPHYDAFIARPWPRPLFYADAVLWDAVLALRKTLEEIIARHEPVESLEARIRAVDFQGMSGRVQFESTGEMRNSRKPTLAMAELLSNVPGRGFQVLGSLSGENNLRINMTSPPQGGVEFPLVCPRGTHGVQFRYWYNCQPCAPDSYVSDQDSLACQQCPQNAICPRGAPFPLLHSAVVAVDGVFPKPARTLGTDRDRIVLVIAVVIPTCCLLFLVFLCAFLLRAPQEATGRVGQLRHKLLYRFQRLDLLFSHGLHRVPIGWPRTAFHTSSGSVSSLSSMVLALAVTVYIVVEATQIDVKGVEVLQRPGLQNFAPQSGFNLTMYVMGSDTGTGAVCQQFCASKKEGDSLLGVASSANVPWNWTCHSAEDRGGCRINAWPIVDSSAVLPSEFWLRLQLAQTRVHGFQWIVSTKFQGETEYFTSGNVTAPHGGVLSGGNPSVVTIDLVPTSYHFLRGDVRDGYVPFSLNARHGTVKTSASHFDFADDFTSRVDFVFNVPRAALSIFSEETLASFFGVVARIVTLVSATMTACSVALIVYENLGLSPEQLQDRMVDTLQRAENTSLVESSSSLELLHPPAQEEAEEECEEAVPPVERSASMQFNQSLRLDHTVEADWNFADSTLFLEQGALWEHLEPTLTDDQMEETVLC